MRCFRDYPMLTKDVHSDVPAVARIAIARNGLNALEVLGPKVLQCVQKARPTPMNGARFMLAQGDRRRFIADGKSPANGTRTLSIVHATPLIMEMLVHAPRERLHPSQ